MKPHALSFTLAAVLLAPAAFAAPATTAAPLEGSSLALPVVSCEDKAAPASSAAMASGFTVAPQVTPMFAAAPPRYESIRYRPRRRVYVRDDEDNNSYRRHGSSGFSQLHAGFFDPNGDNVANDFVFGFRGGTNLDDHFQLGLATDWHHRSDRNTVVVSQEPLPGGGTSERRRELARSSSNLFPIMAFLQLTPGGDLPIIPYFGASGGYEVLFLSAEDFQTGEKFDGTFGGWGWQAWAGAALPLSGRSRLNAEVYTNTTTVERDVNDPLTGDTFHEIIDLDGVGMRFGVSWGF